MIPYMIRAPATTGFEWFIMFVGSLVAFIVSVIVIKFFMSYIKKHDFKAFGAYRIVLGIIVFKSCKSKARL